MLDIIDAYWEQLAHHRRWYVTYEKYDHLKRWEGLLVAQPQAAICEALVREELERYVDLVYPHEDLANGGPNFKCYRRIDGVQRHFYVDSTCITIDAAARETGLPQAFDGKVRGFALLTDRFKEECRGKTRQLSNLDAPGLLAIGTLHSQASGACFGKHAASFILTSETAVSQNISTATGEPIGKMYLTTDMKKSTFQRPVKDAPWILEDASRSVSGLLLCPFGGGGPYDLHGVLHPNAVRPFDVELLPGIPFSVVDRDDAGGFNVSYRWHERG